MKLSEYRGEDAIELLADILEPTSSILADAEIIALIRGGGKKIDGVKIALKRYKREVLEILAVLEGEPVDIFAEKCNILTLPAKLLEILNDDELVSFFISQLQNEDSAHSGAVTEITEATAGK